MHRISREQTQRRDKPASRPHRRIRSPEL